MHLRLGKAVSADPRFAGPDLPRDERPEAEGPARALIGDPRNDENLIVSQLQSVFIRFHNKVLDKVLLEQPSLSRASQFKEAQRLVRWHYQWIVVHDFLPHILGGTDVINDILAKTTYSVGPGNQTVTTRAPRLRFFHWHDQPFIPVEFSAAYRFGHSMVRPSYQINDIVTVSSRVPIFSDDVDPLANLNGFRPLPAEWGFQWKFFYDLNGPRSAQRSYKIDAGLAAPLGALPGEAQEGITRSLALRNLLRGQRLSLPAGEDVARAMGITPLTAEELDLPRGASDLIGRAPLWYYILREAQKRADSEHLGPVGGRIVAEVLLGLLIGDALSYLNVNPTWQPELADDGNFTMPTLLSFTIENAGL